MVFILFGESWSRWELSFKIVTPILHIVFTAAQIHGSRILLSMWRKEKRKLVQEENELHDIETDSSSKKKEAVADEEMAVVVQASTSLSDSNTIQAESSAQTSEENEGGRQRSKLRKALGFLRPIGHYITGR